MKEKNDFALVPRSPSAVEKAAPGAKPILAVIVADILALAPVEPAPLAPETFNEREALRAYAKMVNNLSADYLEPLLADDFHYTSQMVFWEITSEQQFLGYIRARLEAIKTSRSRVWAELCELSACFPGRPCVVVAQDDPNRLVGTVLAKIEGRKIKRLDMCIVPPPEAARRSGQYPV